MLFGYVLADDTAPSGGGISSGSAGFGGSGYTAGTASLTGSNFAGGSASGSSNGGVSIGAGGQGNMATAPVNGLSLGPVGNQNQIIGTDLGAQQQPGVKDATSQFKSLGNTAGTAIRTSIEDPFQVSVQIRTGLFLNRYGYDLLSSPSSFAPNDSLPASNNYVLGPGDQVSIKAWGSVDIDYTAQVDKQGNIFIPKVGKVSLTGVKSANLSTYLKNKIGRIYRNFSLSASVANISSIQIMVAGFANKPGSYTISSLSTLTNAIFATGGPSKQGSLRRIQLKRNGVIVTEYDMYDLLLNGNDSSDVRLVSGDTIYIRPVGAQAAIYDGVKVPGIYEIRPGETVKDIVRFAGGYTFDNDKKQLIIEKISEHNKIDVQNFTLADGLTQPLENSEIIHFFKMPNRYNDAVVLIGNVVNPSRFAWKAGLKVKDIIPEKEALLTKSFWNSYSSNIYAKDNILQAFGGEKTNNWSNIDTAQSQFSSGLNSNAAAATNSDNVFWGADNLFIAGPIAIPEADINWNYAVIVRLNPTTYRSELIPFDLESAIAGDPKNNLALQPGDIINVLSAKDVRSPSRKGILYVFIDGEVNRPGVYELKSGDKLLDAVAKAGGTTKDAYIYGLELDRQSVKKRQKAALMSMLDNIQQSLLAQATSAIQSIGGPATGNTMPQIVAQQQAFIEKLRQVTPSGRIVLGLKNDKVTLDKLPNMILENGDTIYIPTLPNTVDVIGQVYNPSTFAYNKHNSVGDYINQAGTTNDFADNSSIYVLHADGTLYSKQQSGWFNSFSSQKVYPGDVVVVPQDIQFSTLTTNLINWTQILANFGLGVAAIRQLN